MLCGRGHRLFMKRRLAFLAVLLAMTLPAAADTMVQLTGVGGANQGGVYVYPYFLKINGHTLSVMCDDYTHDVYIGEKWEADIVSFAEISQGRFWDPAHPALSLHDYEMLFWLFSEAQSHPGQAANINFAAWSIFDPGLVGHNGWTTGPNAQLTSSSAWLYAAQHFNGNFDYSSYYLIVPEDLSQGGPQEYIAKTPEPAALALTGTGLIAIGFVRRWFAGR